MNWIKRHNNIILLILFIILFISLIVGNIKANAVKPSHYNKIVENNSCIALNYHRVRDDSIINKFLRLTSQNKELREYSVFTNEFESQIKWLKAHNANFVTTKELLNFHQKKKFPNRCVWINFDDADKSIYDNAFNILKKYNVSATIFIIAGHVGEENFQNLELMNWDELNVLKNSGLIEFGSHTYDLHELELDKAKFTEVSDEVFKLDLIKSREEIKKHMDIDINTFAFPYGKAEDRDRKIVKSAGFDASFILTTRPITEKDDIFRMNRILIHNQSFDQQVKTWSAFD
ncbi:intercellular adhesin biosynthesis polysaccharide N-deacetylase [Macrococcus sp. EM39E]|uniref:intercellular adhesin biosynthesis polysaccharide N-deacetylase n=1 Tax=Macrococcus animalis TaxID=3395467 RepID=UPI0039BF8535